MNTKLNPCTGEIPGRGIAEVLCDVGDCRVGEKCLADAPIADQVEIVL